MGAALRAHPRLTQQNTAALFLLFTLLVCNRAGRLASRLAGRLAFAASAFFGTFAQNRAVDCLYHSKTLPAYVDYR